MNRNRYWEVTEKDWYETALALLASIAVIVIILEFLLPGRWYLWLLVSGGGIALLATWHARNFAYRCPACNRIFEVSTLEDFLGPNGVNKKYLRCPKCGKRAWADIMRIKEQTVVRK